MGFDQGFRCLEYGAESPLQLWSPGSASTAPAAPASSLKLTTDALHTLVIPEEVRKRVISRASAKKLTTLRLEGLTLPPGASGVYTIIANNPQANAAAVVGTPNALGYIAIVPKTSQGAHLHGNLSVALNLTKHAVLLNQSGKLELTLAAVAGGAGTPLTAGTSTRRRAKFARRKAALGARRLL